jgi:hypothetical protein
VQTNVPLEVPISQSENPSLAKLLENQEDAGHMHFKRSTAGQRGRPLQVY